MAAFTGHGPTDEDREKQDRIKAGLEAKVGGQDAPSPQGAASQGALGSPAQAGGDSGAAFDGQMSGKEMLFGKKDEPQVGGGRYLDMHMDAPWEDLVEATNVLDRQFGKLGSGVIAKATETIQNAMKSGDEKTLELASDYGWMPNKGQAEDSALGQFQPTTEEPTKKDKRGKWSREDMGGFLTEMGLRILASNRDDLGGALGEAGSGMIADKRQREREAAALQLDASERERQHKREDAADQIARDKEAREKRKDVRAGLEKLTLKNGEVIWANIEEGYAVDKDTGERLRELTTSDLSASNRRIAKDNLANAHRAVETRLDKLIEDGNPIEDSEVEAIIDETDQKKKKAMKAAWIKEKLESYDYSGSDIAGTNPLELEL